MPQNPFTLGSINAMAERRMMTKKVTDDDNFMQLSASAQALYLHLNMSADDDGFCNQVSICMFKAHASVQDLQSLLERRYIYQFENGVIVIKHWRMANALRKDRYTPTAFKEELAQLSIKDNGSYTRLPSGCQMVANCLPQDRLDKDRKDKDRLSNKFTPPTLEEVQAYCDERHNSVDAKAFFDYYTADPSRMWIDSKGKPVRSWKQKVITWERTSETKKPETQAQKKKRLFEESAKETAVSFEQLENLKKLI